MQLAWTTEKPTKPGWYWWRSKFLGPEVRWVSTVKEIYSPNYGEWAGPLEVPA